MESSDLIELTAAVTAVVLAGVALAWRRSRSRPGSSTADLVRRRKALRGELLELVPDPYDVDRRLQAEARRLGVSDSSIEAYEGAIKRASKANDSKPNENGRTGA